MSEQKIEGVPEGWELVRIGLPENGEWFLSAPGKPYEVQLTSMDRRNLGCNFVIIRKIEKPKQYRPFANGEEFRPHRDRWWKWKGRDDIYPPGAYSTVSHCDHNWEVSFVMKVFDDGSPFGVEVTE